MDEIWKNLRAQSDDIDRLQINQDSQKKYTMDLAKTLGFQVHNALEQSEALKDDSNQRYLKHEQDVANLFSKKIDDVFTMIEGMKDLGKE